MKSVINKTSSFKTTNLQRHPNQMRSHHAQLHYKKIPPKSHNLHSIKSHQPKTTFWINTHRSKSRPTNHQSSKTLTPHSNTSQSKVLLWKTKLRILLKLKFMMIKSSRKWVKHKNVCGTRALCFQGHIRSPIHWKSWIWMKLTHNRSPKKKRVTSLEMICLTHSIPWVAS